MNPVPPPEKSAIKPRLTLRRKTSPQTVSIPPEPVKSAHKKTRPKGLNKPRSPRQLAREMALQTIYHGLINPGPIELIIAQVIREQLRTPIDVVPHVPQSTEEPSPYSLQPVLPQKTITHAGALLRPIQPSVPVIATTKSKKATRPRFDNGFFRVLSLNVCAEQEALKASLSAFTDRPADEISPMVFSVLLLGAYEIAHQPITPIQVILNESIELAKRFASEESYRYVNGVLEKFAKDYRTDEMSSVRKPT